jgi:hypothetical protein
MHSSFFAGSIGARTSVTGMANQLQAVAMTPTEMKKSASGVRKAMVLSSSTQVDRRARHCAT